MSANCPHCAKPLDEQQLEALPFRCCRDCKGMLLLHHDLIDVLEKSWRAVPQETAETTEFLVTDGWRNEPAFLCPDCHQQMEKYGYMGIAAIQIDRCDPCSLVWLDANELQNMVLALAKSNYRSESAWQKLQRERVDMVESGVQGASQVGRRHGSQGWLFNQTGQNFVVAEALLYLLLPKG
jgi:Zn-finger nucleic acid-binding protein